MVRSWRAGAGAASARRRRRASRPRRRRAAPPPPPPSSARSPCPPGAISEAFFIIDLFDLSRYNFGNPDLIWKQILLLLSRVLALNAVFVILKFDMLV